VFVCRGKKGKTTESDPHPNPTINPTLNPYLVAVRYGSLASQSQVYQPFLPPVSEQELCERVRRRVPAPMYATDVWYSITYC